MRFWLVRGCVLAVLNAAAQTALSSVAVYHPSELTLLRPLALGVLAGVGVLWGACDTWFVRLDRGIGWIKAAILAGLLAGVLGVVGKGVFVDATGAWALGDALTGGAAFTALLVIVPAGAGLLLGRLLGTRHTEEQQARPPARPHTTSHRTTASRRAHSRRDDRSGPLE